MTARTPGPWTVNKYGQIHAPAPNREGTRKTRCVARTEVDLFYGDPESDKANAAFIVKAVNNHDALVEELTLLVETFHGYQGMEFKRVKALLAKLEEN